MDFKNIKKAVKILDENSLTEFSYEKKNEFKLTLKREVFTASSVSSTFAVENKDLSTAITLLTKDIKAPLVGTYYSASNPKAPSYVKIGDSFKEDDTLCIIEAMKVMNKIKAETSGVISKIFLQDGDAVEYNQPLFEYK